MPICSNRHIDIYYEIHGQGPPLLLISGLGGGTWSWYGQVPYFEKFYTTIIFDNRGAGKSSMPPGPYTMSQLAEDALRLLDHLQVSQTFVLGISMGGMIAQELALLAPARIRALGLGCTHCGGKLPAPLSPAVLERFMDTEGLTDEQIVDKNLPFFFSDACRKNHPEALAAYRAVQLRVPRQPAAAFAAQLAAIKGFNARDRLAALHIPTRIIQGTEDVLVPVQNARLLAQCIAGAELIEIAGAGHALHAECRDQFNGLTHHFYQQHCDRNAFAETD